MGFLNNVTNNIILDAVLTDEGRARLARNDASFVITHFALGDDEVDYTIIKKYGRAVGKEKIEKNTPILEALTQGTAALKSPLVSSTSATLTKMPTVLYHAVGGGFTTTGVEVTTAGSATAAGGRMTKINATRFGAGNTGTVTFRTAYGSASATAPSIPADLQDSSFIVTVDTRLLKIPGFTPINVDSSGVGRYQIAAVPAGGGGGVQEVTIPLQVKAVSDETFNAYLVSGATIVTRYMTLTGRFSGAHVTARIDISNTTG